MGLAALLLAAGGMPAGSGQTTDDASEWRFLHGRTLTARYRGSDSLRASRAPALLESLERLPGLPGPDPRLTETIAPTRAAMDSLVGGRLPEWAGAVAIRERMEMIIPGGRFWPRTPWCQKLLCLQVSRVGSPAEYNSPRKRLGG